MPHYEYKVVAAPTKGVKARGLKTPEARFANSVESLLNTLGADGWEYLRAELLPSDERSGLTGSTTNWRNVLVFRRAFAGDAEVFQPRVLDGVEAGPGESSKPQPEPQVEPHHAPEKDHAVEADQEPKPKPAPRNTKVPKAILQFTNMTGRAARDDNAITPEDETPEKNQAAPGAEPKT